LFLAPRTFQRTIYRPGEICQFDLWQPSREIAVGHGQTRKGYVVVACLGYSRVGAGALVFSKEVEDLLWGIARCLWSFGALPGTLVWDRKGALHAGGGRPTDAMAGLCGQLKSDWYFCEARDPQAKGAVEKLQQYFETNFEPGRQFANPLDFQRSSTRGLRRRTLAPTAACAAGRSTAWPRSSMRCARCRGASSISTGGG